MNRHDPRRLGSERGSAMVEFSILMIVFVPMLTYGFYISDLGHHLLDLQETVISTTWDYTSRTHEGTNSGSGSADDALDAVFHLNRMEYLDHTSAYDHFGSLNSTTDQKKYHYELGGRVAWVAKGTENNVEAGGSGLGKVAFSSYASDYKTENPRQVTCAVDQKGDLGWILGGEAEPIYNYGNSGLARGGAVTCWAKLQVYNYVIPEKFLKGQFAHVDMTKSVEQKHDKNVEELNSSEHPLVLRDHAAVSFGTWAINNADTNIKTQSATSADDDGNIDYCMSAHNPFFDRVAWIYTGGASGGGGVSGALAIGYGALSGMAGIYSGQAMSKNLGMVNVLPSVLALHHPAFTQCDADLEAGLPGAVLGVHLVANHDRGETTYNGVVAKSPMGHDFQGMLDVGARFVGSALGSTFESTPWDKTNSKYKQAFQKRGYFYMGASTDNG